MNEWLKNMIGKLSEFWKKSSVIKKVILCSIIVLIIVAIVVLTTVSSKPSQARVFSSPVNDEQTRLLILDRISEENVDATISDDGYIFVSDEATATRLRTILVTERLVPSNIDPFESFYNRNFSITDKEQNVKLKNAMTIQIKRHLEVISDIASANVTLVLPETELFKSEQDPVSASVILNIRRNSNLPNDKRRLLGIQELILSAVQGLQPENLTISDMNGNVLNDFEEMAEFDKISAQEKSLNLRRKEEAKLKAEVLTTLQKFFTEDRIRDLNVSLEVDLDQKESDKTIYTPIQMRADNKDTPYDESVFVEGLPISQQTVTKEWQGTGYNPEGPAGVEGQTPPVYSDMSNVIGKSTETGVTQNNAINTTHEVIKTAPVHARRTISVNVDGKWTKKRNLKTNTYEVNEYGIVREYTPLSEQELRELEKYVRDAIGYNRDRGDSVTITNIQFDRTLQFQEEDDEYFKKQQTRRTVLLILIAITVVLVGFILFRIISKEIERRRRLRDEERLRQQQAAREQTIWEAGNDANMQVSMSVEESRRAELQENAINMAKEHPEDVAMLIRTWLMEE